MLEREHFSVTESYIILKDWFSVLVGNYISKWVCKGYIRGLQCKKCFYIMIYSYRFLVFGYKLEEPILWLSGFPTPDLEGGFSPTLTFTCALSGKHSKPQHISYNKEERHVDIWLISCFSDSFSHPYPLLKGVSDWLLGIGSPGKKTGQENRWEGLELKWG